MVHLEKSGEWFATWFDSPYYHVLYDHRNDDEAKAFIERLMGLLPLQPNAEVLDLCCGAGRHSRVIHALGYRTTGCDLSENSIQTAKQYEQEDLKFFVHDMRDNLPQSFDAILNLFTSFGYFDDISENLKVLQSVYAALPKDGIFVIDFMNAEKVIAHLKQRQEIVKTCDKGDVKFHIQRQVNNGRIVKSIAFEAEGQSYFYQEKVQALKQADFIQLFEQSGFEVLSWFGDYACNPFDLIESDRLIAICKK